MLFLRFLKDISALVGLFLKIGWLNILEDYTIFVSNVFVNIFNIQLKYNLISKYMNITDFAKEVERLVNPIDVGGLHVIQRLNNKLPIKVQEFLVKSSAKKMPYMGFIVEPYSFFMVYEITNLQKAQSLLPDGFKLIKTKVFENDEPNYYAIFGCFRAHTSAFWGSRIEFYIIAENEKTGLLSWIIVDYDSNTIGYDKRHGLRSPSSKNAVFTVTHDGRVVVDFQKEDGTNTLKLDCDITNGELRKLDQRLWLEGNLSVGYGRYLNGSQEDMFSLIFDPAEVEDAFEISKRKLNLEWNSWYLDMIAGCPEKIVCFPYAQHFISDSPGSSGGLKNREDLLKKIEELDFNKIQTFSIDSMFKMFGIGIVLNLLVVISLVLLIIFL
jgi:hypothetical protein